MFIRCLIKAVLITYAIKLGILKKNDMQTLSNTNIGTQEEDWFSNGSCECLREKSEISTN